MVVVVCAPKDQLGEDFAALKSCQVAVDRAAIDGQIALLMGDTAAIVGAISGDRAFDKRDIAPRRAKDSAAVKLRRILQDIGCAIVKSPPEL